MHCWQVLVVAVVVAAAVGNTQLAVGAEGIALEAERNSFLAVYLVERSCMGVVEGELVVSEACYDLCCLIYLM